MTAPRRLLTLLVAGLVSAGCGGNSKQAGPAIPTEPQDSEPNKGTPGVQDATGGKVDIDIRERSFTPRVMHVKVGQIIVWTDDDNVGHTVRADRGSLPHSGLIPVKGRFEFTPLKAGRIAYHCIIHPGMHGVVIVAGR
jgi:plastocyanin